MTNLEFKKAIRDNWIDFRFYFQFVCCLGGGIFTSFQIQAFNGFGRDLFPTALAIVPCVLFIGAINVLWFVHKSHYIQTVVTGKSIRENQELIKTLITFYNATEIVQNDNHFSFRIQGRDRNWVDFILVMNNYADIFILTSDSLIEINVYPTTGGNLQVPGNIKMAERIRGEIVERIKTQIAQDK